MKQQVLNYIDACEWYYGESGINTLMFNRDGIVVHEMQFVLLKDDPEKFFDVFRGLFEKTKDAFEMALMMTHKSLMIQFISEFGNVITKEQLGEALRKAWVHSEFPNVYATKYDFEYKEYFRKLEKELFMSKEEVEKFKNLPDKITCYRGVYHPQFRDGMSFTLDKDKAQWFANRFGEKSSTGGIFLAINGIMQLDERIPKLYKVEADKKDVLAYFEREDEVVVDLSRIQNKDWVEIEF